MALVVALAASTPVGAGEPCRGNTTPSTVPVAASCGLEVLGALDVTDTGLGQVAVHDDMAAVVQRDDGVVALLDLADPSAPAVLGRYDGGTGVADLDHPLDGDLVFSADGQVLLHARQTSDWSNEGLHVLDVSDPTSPTRTDLVAQGGMLRVAYGRMADGTELVATLDATHGLTVLQLVRTPLGPRVVPLHVDPMTPLGVGGPASAGLEIVPDDPVFGVPTMYVSTGTDGLVVLDLSVPAAPRELARWGDAGLAAIAVQHVTDGADGDHVLVHAAAEYWFEPATAPFLRTIRIDADGTAREVAKRVVAARDLSVRWKLGGMALVDGGLALAHGHGGLVVIDPADGQVLAATTDLGSPAGLREDLGGTAWYAMDVTPAGEDLLLATDAVTGTLTVLRRT